MQIYDGTKDMLMVYFGQLPVFFVARFADVEIAELEKIGKVILVDNVPAVIHL